MAETTESSQEFIPPASFSFLIESFLMQTQMQLGLIRFGEVDEGQPEPNFALARHSIDMLAMLQEKTKGNLTAEEHRLLENGLTELRFRFVQVSEEAKKHSLADTGEQSEKKEDDRPRIITADGGKGSKTE